MKLWHDDIRPAPEGWVWARTNKEAMAHLETGDVEEISLDHDLGLHDLTEEQIEADPELLFGRGQAEETGYHLVEWMIEHDCVPEHVTIHSWNPSGADMMANRLNRFGYNCRLEPFALPAHKEASNRLHELARRDKEVDEAEMSR